MGIRFYCPNGHKLNVKAFQAGQRGLCPDCGVSVDIPLVSTRPSSKSRNSHPQDHASVEPEVILLGDESMQRIEEPTPIPGNAVSRPRVIAAVSPTHVPKASSTDAISETPNAVWYARPPAGGQYGPAPGDVMRNWIAEGRISGDTFVWREGWRDWRRAGEVFPALAQPEDAYADLAEIVESSLAVPEPSPEAGYSDPIVGKGIRGRSKRISSVLVGVLTCLGILILLAIFIWIKASS
jgi:hypothetical protein